MMMQDKRGRGKNGEKENLSTHVEISDRCCKHTTANNKSALSLSEKKTYEGEHQNITNLIITNAVYAQA